MIARLARSAAVAIAIAAVVDPAWTTTIRGRGTVGVVEPDGSRVGERLARDYRVLRGFDGAAVLVVVGRAYPLQTVPANARVATVTLPADPATARVAAIATPAAVPVGTAVHLEATILAGSSRPAQTTVTARIGGVVVGRTQHTWTRRDDRWRASLDVVPVGAPPWVVTIAVEECLPVAQAFRPAGGAALKGCATDVVVDPAPRIAVTFYEPRPSWATTFARRALERDPRFAVEAATRLGAIDASAVVVGGLDRVTDADVSALDRFVRDRGGAVIVLPDERIATTSPVMHLLTVRQDDREVLLDRAAPLAVEAPLPPFAASELITFTGPAADVDILARSPEAARPVVWAARRGEGRVVVSGALDAWRFRAADNAAFDRFWRAAISGAALATRPLVDAVASPAVARPLETVHVHARVHRSLGSGALSVSATLSSGGVVRLWPDAEQGSFSGTFTAPARSGVLGVSVTAANGSARAVGTATVAVSQGTPGTLAPLAPLSLLAESHAGVNVAANDLAPLDHWLRATVTTPTVSAVRRPMRSPWWMLPFFACLSIDWWITSSRRRRR